MKVEIPLVIPGPHGSAPVFARRGRKYSIRNATSIRSITLEIYRRDELEQHGLIKFNLPNAAGKIPYPILTMESDTQGISLTTHRAIARYVGKILHREYRCQVQIVWSGNKSYHVHFRINRTDVVPAEAVAIQNFLTEAMEERVRRKFKLPTFAFDRLVMKRLELVRLGLGTRTEIGGKPVCVKQTVDRYWDSDFRDSATIFPMDEEIKKVISADTPRKARNRAKKKTATAYARPRTMWLRRYAKFLEQVGESTVRPNHWGYSGENRKPVLICYYGPRDKNPSCVLARDSYFVTDSRGRKHPVVYSYKDFRQARLNDLRTRKKP